MHKYYLLNFTTMSQIVPYLKPSSSTDRRKKLFNHTRVHPDLITPELFTPTAQAKYHTMRHNIVSGLGATFFTFPDLLENFHKIGWNSLVDFTNKFIYPGLMAEFFAHMEFTKNTLGTLQSITTIVQGQEIIIDQALLVEALHLDPLTLDLPKVNYFIQPQDDTVITCLEFKRNLSFLSDQIVPAMMFDVPTCIGAEYFTPQCQFLGRIMRHNIMPVRFDRKLEPYDLELIKCILTKSLHVNLPHFLLTSFEHCYMHNCIGYGLVLSVIFNFLNFDLLSAKRQLVKTSNLVSHMTLPPRPLFLYKINEKDKIGDGSNLAYQIQILNDMQQHLIENQGVLVTRFDSLTFLIQSLQEIIANMMEQQHVSYMFGASVGSVHLNEVDPMDFSPAGIQAAAIAAKNEVAANFPIHFSPISPLYFQNSPVNLDDDI